MSETWCVSANGEDYWLGEFSSRADAIKYGPEFLAQDDPSENCDPDNPDSDSYWRPTIHVGRQSKPWLPKLDGDWIAETISEQAYDEFGGSDYVETWCSFTKGQQADLERRINSALYAWLKDSKAGSLYHIEKCEEVTL